MCIIQHACAAMHPLKVLFYHCRKGCRDVLLKVPFMVFHWHLSKNFCVSGRIYVCLSVCFV